MSKMLKFYILLAVSGKFWHLANILIIIFGIFHNFCIF